SCKAGHFAAPRREALDLAGARTAHLAAHHALVGGDHVHRPRRPKDPEPLLPRPRQHEAPRTRVDERLASDLARGIERVDDGDVRDNAAHARQPPSLPEPQCTHAQPSTNTYYRNKVALHQRALPPFHGERRRAIR